MRFLVPAALVVLSACDAGPGGAELERSALLDGAVRTTAPVGYCVDREISRVSRGFAFMAACALIDPRSEIDLPGALAVVTVQAGAPDSATVAGREVAFRDFLRTEQGLTLLAAGDMGGPLEILRTDVGTNAVRIYTRDLNAPVIAGTQAESWRAFTDVGGRSVTVTVRGVTQQPLSETRSRDLLDRTLADLAVRGTPPGT